MKYLSLLLFFLFGAFASLNSQQTIKKQGTAFTYTCFQNADKTWGYDIQQAGKIFIHQSTVPAVAGLKAFRNKKSALKIAKLAIKKLKANPNAFPTITVDELQKLKIVY